KIRWIPSKSISQSYSFCAIYAARQQSTKIRQKMIAQVVALASLLVFAHGGLIGGEGYGSGGYSSIGGSGISIGGKETVVDLVAPPKYEYKYAVEDHHTGDQKEQQESRIGDLTKSEYGLVEKDRKIQVSRVIHGSIPVVQKGHY
ncbi:unnamed protein product, partial [Phaedon cochleariae]